MYNGFMDELRKITACFTGHRPQRFEWGYDERDTRFELLLAKIRDRITAAAERGFTRFICGGAIGTDIWCGETVLELRDIRGGIELEVVVPCAGQDRGWPVEARIRYGELLERAGDVTVLNRHYTRTCMMERNHNMVSRSGLVIAVFDGVRSGGTWQTIKMAMRDGVELDIINP